MISCLDGPIKVVLFLIMLNKLCNDIRQRTNFTLYYCSPNMSEQNTASHLVQYISVMKIILISNYHNCGFIQNYIGALSKSYSDAGRYFCESVETSKFGLTPAAAGALVQSRAFSTVYQEVITKLANKEELPAVLDSVLQPHVEVYKKNLKPQADGKDVVVAGRIS